MQEIILSDKIHYQAVLKIFLNSFGSKLNFITFDENIKYDICIDFNFLEEKSIDKQFVFCKDANILGFSFIQFYKQHKIKKNYLSLFFKNYRKYGILKTIKALLFKHFLLTMGLNKNELYINMIFVSHEARSLGVGSKLMKFIEDLAIQKGLNILFLDVMCNNERAIKFYQNLGFNIKEVGKGNFLSKRIGYHYYTMTKNIQ